MGWYESETEGLKHINPNSIKIIIIKRQEWQPLAYTSIIQIMPKRGYLLLELQSYSFN